MGIKNKMIHLNKNSDVFKYYNKHIILDKLEKGEVYLYFKHKKKNQEWIVTLNGEKYEFIYKLYRIAPEEDTYLGENLMKKGDINDWNFRIYDVFLLNKKEKLEYTKILICIELDLTQNGK